MQILRKYFSGVAYGRLTIAFLEITLHMLESVCYRPVADFCTFEEGENQAISMRFSGAMHVMCREKRINQDS